MPYIELRLQIGISSPGDLKLSVQQKTYDYLLADAAPEMRISAYLDQDYSLVEPKYAELFVSDSCRFETRVSQVIPGSKVRKGIQLPGEMKEGEQLTVLVTRKPRS